LGNLRRSFYKGKNAPLFLSLKTKKIIDFFDNEDYYKNLILTYSD
jgi:hypothetical protein